MRRVPSRRDGPEPIVSVPVGRDTYAMIDTTDAVRAALDPDRRAAFQRRVEEEAEALRDDIDAGVFDADGFAVGMELEGYVVDGEGRLAAAPGDLFGIDGCSQELGVHNAELHTDPDVVSDAGLRRQFDELGATYRAVQAHLGGVDQRFVLDALWTVPPVAGTRGYIGATTETDGLALPTNMRPVPRYVALDAEIRARNGGTLDLDIHGFESAASMLAESLATSMQPHLQVPDPTAVPTYLNVATRTMGPILSVTSNSPFLPADRYDGHTVETVFERTPHELRIPLFERSVDEGSHKCRVPEDVPDLDTLIDRIVTDPTLVAPPELDGAGGDGQRSGDPGDRYPAIGAKRGTYWRWVRPVFGGDVPRTADGDRVDGGDGGSVRIEYRPLPTQPTIRDTVGVQALVTGVLRGVVATDHPLATLPWDEAEQSFYAAVDDGPGADLHWVTRAGDRTTATPRIYDELFALARRGLDELGVGAETIEWALAPIEARRETDHTAPSAWKRAQVREAVEAGASLRAAIEGMQAAYVERAGRGTPFAEW